LNKITANRPGVAFKGNYIVQGSTDALDQVCWYLQKKRKASEHAFDFVDIRLKKEPSAKPQKLISPEILGFEKNKNDAPVNLNAFLSAGSDYVKNVLKALADNPVPETAGKTSKSSLFLDVMDAFSEEKDAPKFAHYSEDDEPMDLIVTGADKAPLIRKMGDMLTDSIGNGTMDLRKKIKLIVIGQSQMDENISAGKPVTNLRPNIVKEYLGFKLAQAKIIPANEALDDIQRGQFDIETGLNLNA